MCWRVFTICLLSTVAAAALLIAAGSQLDYINAQRQKMNLISNEPLENAPPSLAFATVAMGAFRGIVVDVLWMRADRLKQAGQFFDAKQLAEWITMLQPRFASVWEFQAWNMAYNISVAIPATEPEQRWRWVKNGYELLRDKAIPLNPNSTLLYRELARIFQHKIGDVADDAHKYYKLQLVEAMQPLLGPATHEYFKALADAPTDWNQAIKDKNVAAFVDALKAADQAFASRENFLGSYLGLRQNPNRFDPNAVAVIDNYRGTEILRNFDLFAKANQLRTVWKLEPALMDKLNHNYGPIDFEDPDKHLPLDWRHPDTHAIYWAVKGLEVTGREFSVPKVNTDRIINHSLQNLFRNGKIYIYDVPAPATEKSDSSRPASVRQIYLRPDLRMFEPYNQSVLARMKKYENIDKTGTYESLQTGHRNMLVNAVFSFYLAGHEKQARKIYNDLRKRYPSDEFKVPLVIFARNRLREELKFLGIHNAKEMVEMLLRESYFRYAMRDDDEAFAREQMAKEAHQTYQSMYKGENRIDLPSFERLRYLALLDFFNDRQYPLSLRRSLLARIKIERPELANRLQQQEKLQLQQLPEKAK